MAATILSDEQCRKIKKLNKEFEPFAKKGWMCEGSDVYGLCNCIFNNDTDEIFWATYNGTILEDRYIKETSMDDIEEMARIQGAIRKI